MEYSKSRYREALKQVKERLKQLNLIWQYSDSQPTEITLAGALVFLFPLATYIEIGYAPIIQLPAVVAGLYQLYCVSGNCIKCRVRASFITFSFYAIGAVLYFIKGYYWQGASYWGWLLLTLSSFGSLKRIKKEQLHRKDGK